MVIATISFMLEEAPGSVGSLSKNSLERRGFADASMSHNLKNPSFRKLFQKELSNPDKYKPKPSHVQKSQELDENRPVVAEGSWQLYGLYGLVIILVIAWACIKGSDQPDL